MSHLLWTSLIKWSTSPNEIYFLDCCKNKIVPTKIINQDTEYVSCLTKGFITEEKELTALGEVILKEFNTHVTKTTKTVTKEVLGDNFMTNVKEYREMWPSKRLPHGELGRQSTEELKNKFVWFFKTFPQYDWDLVLDAAYYYAKICERRNYQYMMTSSYFIKKTNNTTKDVTSKLADYCEEILQNPKLLDGL